MQKQHWQFSPKLHLHFSILEAGVVVTEMSLFIFPIKRLDSDLAPTLLKKSALIYSSRSSLSNRGRYFNQYSAQPSIIQTGLLGETSLSKDIL